MLEKSKPIITGKNTEGMFNASDQGPSLPRVPPPSLIHVVQGLMATRAIVGYSHAWRFLNLAFMLVQNLVIQTLQAL